jgi:hypothetical protein
LEGAISRPEAASQTLIAGALRWMKETGVIAHTDAGKRTNVVLTAAYADPVPGFPSGLDRLIDDIAAYL